MSDEARGRRFLIATGVTTDLRESAGHLEESVTRIGRLFENDLGYERVTTLGINPARERMRSELNEFAMRCTPDDYLVLYHTGHADIVTDKHRLWMGDTKKGNVVDTLATAELAELLLAGTPVSNLLIILDTCYSGQGGAELLATGFQAAERFRDRKSLLVISTAYPKQQVKAGDFAGLFERAVNDDRDAGHAPRFLSLQAIVTHMDQDRDRKSWQDISFSMLLGTAEQPFLLNPRYIAAFDKLDGITQAQLKQDAKRREDMESFFGLRARGADVPEVTGWNFVGRHTALRELAGWLEDQGDSAARVVTGDPGSGKSAVISRLAVFADPGRQGGVPRQGIPADTIPPVGSIAVAVHARNQTADEVLQALCAAARVTAATPGEFLQARRDEPMLAAIDAIDEAIDPDRLINAVLNPLIEAGPLTGFRLLLGTRRSLLEQFSRRAVRIDLDEERYADSESLRVYAERILRVTANSPYPGADPMVVRAVSEAVARAAGNSFLVALITSRTLASLGKVADPADPSWVRALPGTAAEAMRQDLEYRLKEQAPRALDLLLPLAYAGGDGLPREDIWAPLASALSGRDYQDKDVRWVFENAGSYVVETVESRRSVYRLYHTALAEYLRHGQDGRRVNGQFVEFLLNHVPLGDNGERDWRQAHPYIRSHLARHAADGQELAELTSDPGYLAYAESPGLLAAFESAGSAEPDTRPVAAAYERALHRLRASDLASRLSYLEFAARRSRAEALADRIARYPVRRRWSVSWTQAPRDFPHRVLAGHQGPVREVVGISMKDHGPLAASAGDDGSVRLWDLTTGEQAGVSQVSSAQLAAVDLIALRDGTKALAALSADGMLATLELPSLSRIKCFPVRLGFRNALHLTQLVTAEMHCERLPDGRWAAVTGGPGMMTAVWDIETGASIIKLSPGIQPARVGLRQEGDGELAAVVTAPRVGETDVYYPGAVRRAVRVRTGTPMPGVGGDLAGKGGVRHAVPSAEFPFRVRVHGRVMMLSPVVGPARAQRTVVLTGHGADITDADVVTAPDGSAVLVSSSVDGTVRLWDALTADDRPSSGENRADPSAVLTATGTHRERTLGLVTAAGDKPVEIVDLRFGEQVAQLRSDSGRTLGGICAQLPGLGDAAVTFTQGGYAALWILPAGGLAGVFPTKVGSFRRQAGRLPLQSATVALPGRPLAITCGHGSRAIVWDLADGRIHNVLRGHTGIITALACAATDEGLPVAATSGQDNKVILWDVVSGRRIARFRVARRLTYLRRSRSGAAQTVCLARTEGTFVVLVLCEDGQLRILRRNRRWSKLRRVTLDTNGASSLAVLRLPGGRLIAMTGTPHGQLRAWDIAALLAGNVRDGDSEALLTGIETELSITDLTVTGDDTVVASTLTGLAAFRFDTELLALPAAGRASR